MTRLSADLPFRNEGGGHVDQSKNAEPAACSSCRDSALSGCYAAPVNEATEQGGETSGDRYRLEDSCYDLSGSGGEHSNVWQYGRLRFDRRVLAVGYVLPALYSGL